VGNDSKSGERYRNIGMLPVCQARHFARFPQFSGVQVRWAHRLKVYVPPHLRLRTAAATIFPVMMKLLRKHRDWLMIVIAILAIPFVFYFVQRPDYGAMRADKFARIYDRNVSMLEAQQMVRLLTLAQALGMSDFVQTLTAGAGMDPNQTAVQFVVNLLVLRHEAARLGIRPGYSEIAEVVRTLPAFQGDSGFDMKKFTDFAQNALAPMGLAEEHIEQLVRDQLSLNQIKQLLAAGVTVPKGELDENFQRGHDTLFVTVIRFQSADLGKDVKVGDEDMQKHYDAHKAELKTDEKRKVEFVSLALTDEEKKLTGKQRIDALQKLSDRATDFTQALLEKGADFKQAAAKLQLPIHETGEFTKATWPRCFQAVNAGAEQRSHSSSGWILYLTSHGDCGGASSHTRRSETENRGNDQEVESTGVNVDEGSGCGSTTPRSEAVRTTTRGGDSKDWWED